MKKFLLNLFWALLLLGSNAFAQNRKVTGVVTGKDDGLPLPGVSVIIKGTNIGTQTGADGSYSLNVPEGQRAITFSFIGYNTQTVPVTKNVINIVLVGGTNQLNEVVVTGYGGVKSARDVSGNIGHVSGSTISAQPIENFAKGLAGKTAGVQVSSAGGTLGDGIAIRVRGVNSISSSSQPLYVIDGIPFNASNNLSILNGGQGTRFDPLSLINPDDIESIDILKDAGAGVIYGSRAANGVVLITTKKGKKGTAIVTLDSKNSWASPSRRPKLLNGDQFTQLNNEKTQNRFGTNVAFDSDINGDGVADRTDWTKLIFKTGFQTDNNISMSGGSDKAVFYGSVRYADQKGIVYANRLQTAQARMSADFTPNKYLKAGLQMSYTRTANTGVLTDSYLAGATVSGYNAFPTVSPFNPNGTAQQGGFNITGAGAKEGFGQLGLGNNIIAINGTSLIQNRISNPLATAVLSRNNLTPEILSANTYATVTPVKGLSLTSKFGVDVQKNFEDQYSNPVLSGLGLSYAGLVQDYYNNKNQWVWQNYINYDRTIAGDHRISATVGSEYQYNRQQLTYASANNFADPFFTQIIDNTYSGIDPSSSTGALLLASGGNVIQSGLESYFGRASYSFKERYYIEGAYRADAYSGFGNNFRWGKFPSVSASWVVSEEDFLKDNKVISYLKLRGSYGKTGNSRGVGEYAARTLYAGGLYAALNGFSSSQLGNPDLRWESQLKTDFGFNIGFLKNRITLDAAYFNNNINGLILAAPVLYSVGVPNSSITTNIGSMRNRGIELTATASVIKTRDFSWTTNINYTLVKNKVLSLVPPQNADIIVAATVASVGRPVGTYKLLNYAGVDPNNGYAMWYAADGTIKEWNQVKQAYQLTNGTATSALTAADQQYQENKTGTPTWYGGFNNTFTYKQFDLGLNLVFQGGNYIYNSTYAGLTTNYFQNNDARLLNRWTTVGQVTDVPRLYSLDITSNQGSTRFLEKGDFARLQTASFGYRLNKDVAQSLGLQGLRVSAQVYNLFLITGYKGVDPDVNYYRNGATQSGNIASGYDNRGVPQPRTITLSLNASF